PAEGSLSAVDRHRDLEGLDAALLDASMADDLDRPADQVLLLEALPDLRRSDLAALCLRDPLDRLRELDLRPARQVEPVLGLHYVGDAALPRLAVHADDRLVRAADILRVDRQVRHFPDVAALALVRLHPLLDRVLVGAGERGVDEVAG